MRAARCRRLPAAVRVRTARWRSGHERRRRCRSVWLSAPRSGCEAAEGAAAQQADLIAHEALGDGGHHEHRGRRGLQLRAPGGQQGWVGWGRGRSRSPARRRWDWCAATTGVEALAARTRSRRRRSAFLERVGVARAVAESDVGDPGPSGRSTSRTMWLPTASLAADRAHHAAGQAGDLEADLVEGRARTRRSSRSTSRRGRAGRSCRRPPPDRWSRGRPSWTSMFS